MRAFAAAAALWVSGCAGDDGGSSAEVGGTAESGAGSESGVAACEGAQLPCNEMCVDPFAPTLANVHAQVLQGCLAAACHGDAGPAENLIVTTTAQAHANMVSVASLQDPDRNLVQPGDSDASYLIAKLTGVGMTALSSTGTPGVRMPIGFPAICDARLQLVRAWIDAGAPDQ